MDIYHVSYESKLTEIDNGKFSARIWVPRGYDLGREYDPANYPHKLLQAEFDRKLTHQSIYRVCFWSTYEDALNSSKDHFVLKKNVILRFDKSDLLKLGFKDSLDDQAGLLTDNFVHLFWVIENTTEDSFSSIGVPFESISILIDGKWERLIDYMSTVRNDNSSLHHGEQNNECDLIEVDSKNKKAWWKFC